MLDLTLDHLGPIGQFLVGLAAFLGATGAMLRHARRMVAHDVIEATSNCMQKIIRTQLEREAGKADAADYYTLDIQFQGGHRMAVPMFPGKRMLVSENVEMAVQDHGKEQTELGLWCVGFGAVPAHCHQENCETIHIERGTVTHLETGRIYRAGETWLIEPGTWHSALFADCYCRIIHRPPLPTAAVRPADLSAMEKVFPE